MSYTDLLGSETSKVNYLVVLKPARIQESWTDLGSNINSASFDYGIVDGVTIDGVEQSEVTTSAVTNGEFYYDYTNQVLYIYSTTPSTQVIVVSYMLFYATSDAHWHINPLDDTTRQVYYEPIIIQAPSLRASLSDSLFGYMPIESSSIVLGNAEHILEYHLYDSSFNQREILIYHWLDDLEVDNIKLLKSGLMQDIRYSESEVSISIRNRVDLLTQEFRFGSTDFYAPSDWTSLDPNSSGRPVKYVYGMVEGLLFTNVDYLSIEPTTSENRIWAVRADGSNACTFSQAAGGGVHTTTRTYMTTTGLVVGDALKLDATAGADYGTVTAIGSGYIDHTAITAAMSDGDLATRGTVGNITITQNGVKYYPMFTRDWTESVDNGILIITFAAGMEATLGMETLTSTEAVSGRVYGKRNNVTKASVAFGSDSTTYNCLTNPAVILWDLLVNRLGLAESELNGASFDSLSASIGSQEIGFALPRDSGNFPKYTDIIIDLTITHLLSFFLNHDNEWEVSILGVHGTEDISTDNDELLLESSEYNIMYSDIVSHVIVGYRFTESANKYITSSKTNNVAKYLHNVEKQKTFNTLLLNSSDADTLATRLSDIFSERRGLYTFKVKNRFFSTDISDIIKVDLEKMLGYTYTKGTERARKFHVVEVERGLREVTLVVDDNYAIENNSGDF